MAHPADTPVIVLFDGTCGLCHGLVRFLLAHDPAGRLRFAALGSKAARELLGPEAPDGETVVVLADGRTYLRGEAVLALARHLPAPWRWAGAARVLPRGLLDLGYRLVARHRFRLFGRREACPVPRPGEGDRFLDARRD